MADRPRVILALPNVIECGTVADWLASDGFEPIRRPSAKAAAEEMKTRAFDLLIADADAAVRDGLLTAARGRNPRTPTVLIGDSARSEAQTVTGQAMYLARPVERAMLICTVSMAVMDSRPIRRSARKVVNRYAAVVNGVPSHIIDVSNEGLRLEMPRDRRTVPPPYFSVRVPLIGVAVTVQRMWARPSSGSGRAEVTLCGGALAQNRTKAAEGWKVFVETLAVGRGEPTLEYSDSFRI
jgi:hypothetical protein